MCPTRTLAGTLWEIYHGDSRLPIGSSSRGQQSQQTGGLHAAEDGMVSFVTVVALLFFLVLLGLLLNAARVTNQKVEVQNGADAVAYSSALCMARGMNAVTAANHVMGELTAIAVLIDAVGGRELFQPGAFQQPTQTALTLNGDIQAVVNLLPSSYFHDMVKNAADAVTADHGMPTAGGMLYDARMTLKWWTLYAVVVQLIASVADLFPPIGELVGAGLTSLTELVCTDIYMEWQLLALLETLTKSAGPSILEAIDQLLPLVNTYADSIVRQTPLAVQAAVKSVEEANGVQGALYPVPLDVQLPVQPEPPPSFGQNTYRPSQPFNPPPPVSDLMQPYRAAKSFIHQTTSFLFKVPGLDQLKSTFGPIENIIPDVPPGGGYSDNPSRQPFESLPFDPSEVGASQWTRATYPWVQAWRSSPEGAMDVGLRFSLASRYYRNWTNRYTLSRSYSYRTQPTSTRGSLYLYVMQDSAFNRKGQESWTRADGSRLAEQRFMVNGFAYRPPPKVVSPSIYPQPNPDGIVAHAQAMIYNANEKGGAPSGGFQPQVGWDTLNWKSPIEQSGAYEFAQGNSSSGGGSWTQVLDFLHPSGQQPVIVLNWQAKLTPVTRLDEAVQSGRLPGNIQKVLRSALDHPDLTNH